MSLHGRIKPTDKALLNYYAVLERLSAQQAGHEGAVGSAFQRLLDDTAKRFEWTLIPQLSLALGGNRFVIPDGTMKDENTLRRGYWEAKDTQDDLDAEIEKKINQGYPLNNIIFEDTRRGVLYQNGLRKFVADLHQPPQLADLLNQFYEFIEPDILGFEQAKDEFKDRVPQLAQDLVQIINLAHVANEPFKAAFDKFLELCQAALNPNISRAAVDEMLVQHLLTERLFRTVFNRPDFIRKNVIAFEIEQVIDTLMGSGIKKEAFANSLNRFYLAIEGAARTIADFGEKQHFLNSVYERFFQGYSVRQADTMGIVMTPQPLVNFMWESVEQILQEEFGCSLGDRTINFLDPCTGTGNFVVNLLRRIPIHDLPRVYKEQLFANEVMLLPYYISSLNIEHTYDELTGTYEPFEGICFVDTLDLAEDKQNGFEFFVPKNTERVNRQKKTPITVIIGNPPYNIGQLNENDNNKNRKYPVIDGRIRQTYAKDSSATLQSKLYDAYVKFFRWAADRLGERDGIICYVSNNYFLDGVAFDGFRKHLCRDFTQVYHLNLGGNARKGGGGNVFGIMVGVGITMLVRHQQKPWSRATNRPAEGVKGVHYAEIDNELLASGKLKWLDKTGGMKYVKWKLLKPDAHSNWLNKGIRSSFSRFMPMGTKAAKSAAEHKGHAQQVLFKNYSLGVSTNRDSVVYDFNRKKLLARVEKFIDDYNAEVDRWKRKGKTSFSKIAASDRNSQVRFIDDFVRYENIKWSRDLKIKLRREKDIAFIPTSVCEALYRPFSKKLVYFADIVVDRGTCGNYFPPDKKSKRNLAIIVNDHGSRSPFSALATNHLPDLHVLASTDGFQCFPFYVYSEDGTHRQENIPDWALAQFRAHYRKPKIGKWDIFYYIYALLHHPGYRAKYVENLKRELPRIPFAPHFDSFAKAGKKLADLHVNYEQLKPYPLEAVGTPNVPQSYRVADRLRLSKDRHSIAVNPTLTLRGLPPTVFDYRLGNRSAVEWVIDQYRVERDDKGNVICDPNRPEDEEYIVRLIGQVVRVSVETMELINGLPKEFEST